MKLIWKLLKQNISKPQLVGFFFANLIGMSIILLSLQFYFDVNPVFTEEDTLFKKDYFTVTKKLGLLSPLASKKSVFSSKEVEDLKQQDFVKDIGSFIPSQFYVKAGITTPDQGGFSTEMFFESVPQQFIDVKSEDWRFSPVDDVLPIILPKNYLDLYNFGYAEARAMPKINEGLIKMVTFDIYIQGNGDFKKLKGNIVGFSTRINTILVPESFMLWANKKYGGKEDVSPSRLIIEVNDITNPQIATYFKSKGYDIDQGNTAASRISMFLKIIVTIVIIIGVIICALSFFILMLSIYLLLEKNMQKMITLRLLGYSKNIVTKPYILLTFVVNLASLVLASIVIIVVQSLYNPVMENVFMSYEPSGILLTIGIGLVISLLLSSINSWVIRSKIE
ncbi:ABC transporter permease [Dysgonomonas sp. 520]|uniref:ABC transporter permease n=1 Tax=Dysgonomonas sp. 520 TaxID=2302931 RepID=UPI0013D7A14A|nr:FtsX-like permease family protein [Dysgonomonas sp. 520]NDW08775.1 ABC transporter permease [Dysgonomonas sp. 520]